MYYDRAFRKSSKGRMSRGWSGVGMLQLEQGGTQASFTGIGSRSVPMPRVSCGRNHSRPDRFPAYPPPMRRLACFFRSLYFSVFLRTANTPPLWRAAHMGAHQPPASFLARHGGRRTAFFGVPYGFDEAVS